MLTLPNAISLGAQDAGATLGGLVLADKNGAGIAGITFTGALSLFGAATSSYARTITVNTPTALSGGMTATGTTGLGGLVFAGTSTLMLNATTPSTLALPVTIANTGGTTAAADGTFGAVPSLTIATGSKLTINTGVAGTVDTINDNALLTLNGTSGTPSTFGKVILTLAGTRETVGGLMLSIAAAFVHNGQSTMLAAGLAPAGTYGALGSGADYQSNDYFAGSGVIVDAATAVPEPSVSGVVLLAFASVVVCARRRLAAYIC